VEVSTPSRILLTGFSGFVGRYLVEQCQALYPDAKLFGVSRHPTSRIADSDVQRVTLIPADITNAEQIRYAVAQSQPDFVFHLAAQSSVAASWADPASTLQINAGGAVQLLEALRAEHLSPRILLVGSGEQYGLVRPEENPIREETAFRPISPYGVSKSAQDLYGYQYYMTYKLPVLRVRLFNSFGPRQTETFVVADFARQIVLIEQGEMEPVLTVGNLQAQRDFLPVEDVARAFLAIAQRGQPGQAYNIGSSRAHSVREILDLLLAHSTMPIKVRQDPARLRPSDIPMLVADISRLRAHTGWEPVIDFEYAIEQTLNYWRTAVAQKGKQNSGRSNRSERAKLL
jgi:GDP-4-dehydro-6-deoxy-D-mannose reductase